jgi:hypothetical protein
MSEATGNAVAEVSTKNLHKTSESIFSALHLITIGVVLLLNTTGIVSWEMWKYFILILFSIWPVFLIFAGLQLIFRKSLVVKTVLNTIGFILFVSMLSVSIVAERSDYYKDKILENSWLSHVIVGDGEYLEETRVISGEAYEAVEFRQMQFNFKSSNFTLKDSDDFNDHVRVQAHYYEEYGVPELEGRLEEGVLYTAFDPYFRSPVLSFFMDNVMYDTMIGQEEVATLLDIDLTSGDGEIQLERITVPRITVKMTSGDLMVNLENNAIPEELNLKMTSGEFELFLPEEIGGIEVAYSNTSGDIAVQGREIEEKSGTYLYKPEAELVMKINLEVTSGNVAIHLE